jgi:hypothetical protein
MGRQAYYNYDEDVEYTASRTLVQEGEGSKRNPENC